MELKVYYNAALTLPTSAALSTVKASHFITEIRKSTEMLPVIT
jgi:hypothetical protein